MLAVALVGLLAGPSRGHSFYRDDVLGTSFQLHVESPSLKTDRKVEAAVLREIDRLSGILSTYSETSELSTFLAGAQTPRAASPELVELLRACDRWMTVSRGAFNPSAELIGQVWRRSAESDRLPSGRELAKAVRLAVQPAWEVTGGSGTITRRGRAPVSLNAIAKGYIIDRACRAGLAAAPGVSGLLLDVGGDLRVYGEAAKVIGIADPWSSADNAPPLCCIEVQNAAVATSGNYERGFEIDGLHYSHIIDPRTGRPVEHVASATVVAPQAAAADVLATILNVLEPSEGVALVDALERTECLVGTRNGEQHKSAGWNRLLLPEGRIVSDDEPEAADRLAEADRPLARLVRYQESAQPEEAGEAEQGEKPEEAAPPEAPEPFIWGHDMEVVVELQLRRGGWRYARPYVAVWIEDAEGKPLRTLALWGNDYQWLPYLRRWYYLHRRDRRLIHAVSRATRPPGRYRIVWDGRANDGKHVSTGRYIVNIEVSREHGTYQLTRQMIDVGSEPFAFETKSNYEVPHAAIEYREKKSANQRKPAEGR